MKNKLDCPKSVETLDIELDGNIYLVEKDKDGNVVGKSEIDGEVVLKMIVTILEQAVKDEKFINSLDDEK